LSSSLALDHLPDDRAHHSTDHRTHHAADHAAEHTADHAADHPGGRVLVLGADRWGLRGVLVCGHPDVERL
jgi:hypothetical protein